MVLLNDKKYACETCIKGHRSSTCNHTDRPLFEIKKKGRPVTQCEHCRELRKSKQVHVKCLCEGKADPDTLVSHTIPAKKANRLKGPTPSAAFPHGLAGVEGTITPPDVQAHAGKPERSSADIPCTCPSGAPCTCCTSHKGKGKDHMGASTRQKDAHSVSSSRVRTPPVPVTGGMGGRVRPIASRPPPLPLPGGTSETFSSSDTVPYARTKAQPHPLSHGHAARSSHGTALYSPYGNPFEQSHSFPNQGNPSGVSSQMTQSQTSSFVPQSTGSVPPLDLQWPMDGQSLNLFSALCECGDGCTCPGCVTHQGSSAMSEGTSPALTCANPGRCVACQNCAMDDFLLPGGYSFDPGQFQPADDWLLQMSTASASGSSSNAVIPSMPSFPGMGPNANQDFRTSNMGMDPAFGFGGDFGGAHLDPFNFSSGGFRSTLPFSPRGPSVSAPVSTTTSTHSLHAPMPSLPSASTPVTRHSSFSPNNTMTQQHNLLSVMNPASTLSRTPSTGSTSSRESSGSDSESSGFNPAGSSSSGRTQPFTRPSNPRAPYSTR